MESAGSIFALVRIASPEAPRNRPFNTATINTVHATMSSNDP